MHCNRCAGMVPEDLESWGVCRVCLPAAITDMGLRQLAPGEMIHKGDKQLKWSPYDDGIFHAHPIFRHLTDAVRTVGMRWQPPMVPHYRRVA